jgi:hypothetical protein
MGLQERKGTNRVGGLLSGIPDNQFQPPRKKQKARLEIDLSNWPGLEAICTVM